MTKFHESRPLELASFLTSRICHDLISPVGAIVNGLELLDEFGDETERQSTLVLIRQSAELASARLQLCRFAFGAIGSVDSEISWSEISRVLSEYMKWEKTDLNWQEHPDSLPKERAKLLINIILMAKCCLPRGGMIRVVVRSQQDRTYSFTVDSIGEGSIVPNEIIQVIEKKKEEIKNSDSALPLYSRYLAHMCGMEIAVESCEGGVKFDAQQKC